MALNGSDGAWTGLFVHFTGATYVCFRGDVHTRVDVVIILQDHHDLLSLVVMMIAGLLAHSHTDARNGSPWEEHLQKTLYAAPRSTPLKGSKHASTCEFDKGKSENLLQISQL